MLPSYKEETLIKGTRVLPPSMGRIKTALVRRLTKELAKVHGDSFTADFGKNKDLINTVANMPSKKIRNIVAGFATRIKRAERN